MIIEGLLTVIYKLLDTLLFFTIPMLPDTVQSYIDTLFDYIVMGAGLLSNYTPLNYLLVLFGILIVVDSAILTYHFVMWILRKIPVLGIS